MSSVKPIDVDEAYKKSTDGRAILVCAYDDQEKCESIRFEGALTYSEFLAQRTSIPWGQEVIFY